MLYHAILCYTILNHAPLVLGKMYCVSDTIVNKQMLAYSAGHNRSVSANDNMASRRAEVCLASAMYL